VSVLGKKLRCFFKTHRDMLLVICILGLGLGITMPEFWHRAFIMSPDGMFHFARLEQVFQALSHFQLPSLVNFIGVGQEGLAANGMYPWLMAIIFILPRFIIHSPILSLAIGFLMINWLTGITSWLLCRYLTNSRRVQLLGVTIYLCNAYHFELLYARVAIGELLAYTFLPLVLLGCLKIWDNSKSNGWLWIAFGMASIANSHVLSLLLVAILLGVVEVYRWYQQKIDKNELLGFLKAGLAAFLSSVYSLGNIVYLFSNNKMTVPFKNLVTIDLTQVSQSILTNRFAEVPAGSWNLGLPVTILLTYLVIQWLLHAQEIGTQNWIFWLKVTLISIVVSLNWWPWEKLATTPLGTIQFWGRLLCLTALSMMVAVVLFCDQRPLKKRTYWIIMIFTGMLALSSLFEFNQSMSPAPAGDAHKVVTSSTYLSTIEAGSYLPEYHPKTAHGKDALLSFDQVKITPIKTVGNRGNYLIETNKPKHVANLQFARYKGISYQFKLNGKVVHSQSKTHLRLTLPQKTNRLTVSSKAPSFDYWLMLFSLLGYIVMVIGFWKNHESKV